MKAPSLPLLPIMGLLVCSKSLCPVDKAIRFAVTGYTRDSTCGSWDVRAETTCHYQCAATDWPGALCRSVPATF
ncbi:resistin [Saccopteryx bilineata]|uniref:resistin n=1 Tax=Saccopteryx bilineata TaxID=59482 RepID=UPI00338FFEA3